MSLTSWTEIRVVVPQGWEELVAEALALDECTTVAFGRSSLAADPVPEGCEMVRTFVSSTLDTPELRQTIRSVLEALADTTGAEELRNLPLLFKPLPPEDYANSWKKSWKPFRVGRIAVLAPWSESRTRPDDLVMRLEPGATFGSGRHPTTRLCMAAVQRYCQPGARVLDAGTGTGILAVTAALCGAREVHGFDIDAHSKPCADDLARSASVAERCTFAHGGFEVAPSGPFDMVVANIYSDIIQLHARALRELLAPQGHFVFSGVPMQHDRATRAAIEKAGLIIQHHDSLGRWQLYCGQAQGGQGAHTGASL